MKPATKAKSVGRGKTTAKRPVSAKKPKTAPKKSPPKKKIAVVPPGLAFGEFEALRKQMDLSLDELIGTARAFPRHGRATQSGRSPNERRIRQGGLLCPSARTCGPSLRRPGGGAPMAQDTAACSAWRGAARLRQNGDGGAGSREPAQPARRLQPSLRLPTAKEIGL